ncbi:DEAD/DEAH box helicase [Methanosarcina sp. Mfa9]|uniref:DEAD/DEAH box helicase n=1 Tax=Methanosarcina sp. Mfa9 TaxID=3439063 RepID=UPI003F87CE19
MKYIEERNEIDINNGEYDCFVGISDIINYVKSYHQNCLNPAFEQIGVSIEKEEFHVFVIIKILEELIDEKSILYVYDRQRVRSRIAELVRYFAYLKQRFKTDYSKSPNLTQMVKLKVKSRYKPRRDQPLQRVLQRIYRAQKTVPLSDCARELLPDNMEPALQLFKLMVKENLSSEKIMLSKFQLESFEQLFSKSISKDFSSKDLAFIIQSSTGSGKTEAFLFPILLYTILTLRKKGTKALLLYPRIDLCNDQMQRLIEYTFSINKINNKPITIGIHHSKVYNTSFSCPFPNCDGRILWDDNRRHFICQDNEDHVISYIVDKSRAADIIISTPDSLHRRLMDREGRKNIWEKDILPKFIVFDEAHIYTNQSGMHVSNVVRRLREKIISKSKTGPIFIASSATIGRPAEFCKKLFSVSDAVVISPDSVDLEEVGREHIVFIKASNPRKVIFESKNLLNDDGDEKEQNYTLTTNLSSMIQTAFCFYHNMLKSDQKNRIIGFIDSIDTIKRLGTKLCDAERKKLLFQLRTPDEILGTEYNKMCPHLKCKNMPPNPYLNHCDTYLDGECWWVMNSQDTHPMDIHIHKSGITQNCKEEMTTNDDWKLMITTSALEVGFDHPSIIGTFQYMAPTNIPGFVQRIGRGGRSPSDMPVSVVVLGSRPLDNFYFHHSSILSEPSSEKLEIPLDSENQYIKTMHITSYLYDYISSYAPSDVRDEAYYQTNTETALKFVSKHHDEITVDISRVFEVPITVVENILDTILEYFRSCSESLIPGHANSKYFQKIQYISGTPIDSITEDLLRIKFELERK